MKTFHLLISAIFFLSTTTNSFAKFDSKPPMKWGKVSEFELELKKYENQPDAPAIILCDYGNIEISNRAMITRHVRIKILSEEGLSYTTFRIPYIYKNDYEDITKLKGQVINIDKKGKLKINKLASFEFSKEILNDEEAVMVFSFNDDVKVGSIIEYQYEIASLNVLAFDDWYFQNELPTLWSEIRFETPTEFTYLMTYKRGRELSAPEKLGFEKQLDWLKNSKLKKALRELYTTNNILYQTNDKRYVAYVINQRTKKIVHKDLPGYPKEKPVYISRTFAPRISLHLFESHGLNHPVFKPVVMAMDDDNYDNFTTHKLRYEMNPAGYIHYKLPTWDKFNNKYLNHERFGMQLMKSVDYISLLDDIVTKDLDNKKKAESIYTKLKSTVKWNGDYSTFTSNDLNKVLKNGEGNSADINLLLTYLFKRSGLDAYPVLVKSKYDGTIETSYPAYHQFSHVIVAVQEVSGKVYLFDLTAPYNEQSIFEIYEKGWAIRKIDYGWLDFSTTETYDEEKSLAEAF